ncbi:hypothetical protein SB48_HM08orf05647 [Heyndrickxia coagulans]|uniref:Uncharacterized protein n=1 Tax=Heyndrickxia coagulans TaxID=1398 RepID=A0AAN0T882_HEYCO|nr:hypothetical protein SB48_HM08orf05647 [Heyndrickxia coagulans]
MITEKADKEGVQNSKNDQCRNGVQAPAESGEKKGRQIK